MTAPTATERSHIYAGLILDAAASPKPIRTKVAHLNPQAWSADEWAKIERIWKGEE